MTGFILGLFAGLFCALLLALLLLIVIEVLGATRRERTVSRRMARRTEAEWERVREL